jgi:hypothetical protein
VPVNISAQFFKEQHIIMGDCCLFPVVYMIVLSQLKLMFFNKQKKGISVGEIFVKILKIFDDIDHVKNHKVI